MREPTHKEGNLLDLILTDVPQVNVTHGPRSRDHDFLIAHIECAVPETITVKREVWKYARADWMRLQSDLAEVDWSFIKSACPHEGGVVSKKPAGFNKKSKALKNKPRFFFRAVRFF